MQFLLFSDLKAQWSYWLLIDLLKISIWYYYGNMSYHLSPNLMLILIVTISNVFDNIFFKFLNLLINIIYFYYFFLLMFFL